MKVSEKLTEFRCKFCIHYLPNGERSFWHRGEITYCRIEGVARFTEDECNCFHPNVMFGICKYCKYYNSFHAPDYCRKDEQPNRRRVYGKPAPTPPIGNSFDFYTCDNYMADHWWRPYILKNLINGRCPANFDPETWGFIDSEQLDGVLLKVETLQAEEREAARLAEEKRPKNYIQNSLF